jgi:hypothetical protein
MVHCPSPWEMSSWELFRFHSTCNYTHFLGLNFRKERLFLTSQIEIRVYITDIMAYSVEYFLLFQSSVALPDTAHFFVALRPNAGHDILIHKVF